VEGSVGNPYNRASPPSDQRMSTDFSLGMVNHHRGAYAGNWASQMWLLKRLILEEMWRRDGVCQQPHAGLEVYQEGDCATVLKHLHSMRGPTFNPQYGKDKINRQNS
jgi:hypothetical protein